MNPAIVGSGADAGEQHEIRVRTEVRPPVVVVSGPIDICTATELRDVLIATIDHHGPDVIVDLSAVTFCDGRGLTAFIQAANHAARRHGTVRLTRVPAQVKRLLKLTRLDKRFLPGT